MRFPLWLRAMVLAVVLAPAGCTHPRTWWQNHLKVGPNYGTPEAASAQTWIDAHDVRVRSQEEPPDQWWTIFDDPKLNALIDSSAQQNLPLRVAGFRILEARAQRGIAVGNFFPQQQEGFAGYTRTRISESNGDIPNNPFSTWQMGFSLAWELDFWGRFRRAIEAADANLEASVANYDDVLVTLLADVASTYVEYRTLERRVELARSNVEIQKGTLGIADAKFKAGRTTELDSDQAKANLGRTEALIPVLEVARRVANNRLCILMGQPPRDLSAELGAGPIPTAPPEAAVGIPGDLLRRRPDIRRAERDLAAQSALIGVAESELYPHISLNGTIGLEANQFSELFDSNATFGQMGPSLRWNILNYGRILSNIRLQDARFQQLVAVYQNTVLQANAEVENALIAFLRSHQRVKSLTEGVDAAKKAVDIVDVQYREGRIDFNRVFQLQEFLVQQQDLLTQAQGDLLLALIGVYRSLGGGWQVRAGVSCTNGTESAPPPRPAAEESPVKPPEMKAPPADKPLPPAE